MGVSVRTKTRSRNMSLLMSSLLLTLASSAEIFHRIPQSRIPNSCSTLSGSTCVFPFSYAGVVYTECATVDQSGPWCSTSITAAGEHIPGSEGFCPSTCPVTGGTSGGSTSTPCTPGTSFTVDCNTCVCNSLGEAVCTTDTCSAATTTTTASTSSSCVVSTTCVVSSGPASGQT